MEKVACPRCGQDYVVVARIRPLDEQIIICPECEAFWWPGDGILKHAFHDIAAHVEERGYTWDWAMLDIVCE